MKKILVPLRSRAYPVYVGAGALPDLAEFMKEHGFTGSVLIVSQKEIFKHWGKVVTNSFKSRGIPFKTHIASGGHSSEKMKSWRGFGKLISACAAADRTGNGLWLVALGGGVVGDITGFAASVYKRGIPYVQVPTTLTAQVDSSIGGKTAIDLPQGKNLLGSIYQPAFVLADPAVLKTLPDETFRDGMAEVIKYAAISDMRMFRHLETASAAVFKKDPEILEPIISNCIRIKARIVGDDERDVRGIRAVLNFGHTFGHALEAAAGFKLTHGHAVAIGMSAACGLSNELRLLRPEVQKKVESLISLYGLPLRAEGVQPKKVLKALGYDKKRIEGKSRFILLREIGRTQIYTDVPEPMILGQIARITNSKKVSGGETFWTRLFGRKRPKEVPRMPAASTQPARPQYPSRPPRGQHSSRSHQSPRPASNRPAPASRIPTPPADNPNRVGVVEAYLGKISVAIVKVEMEFSQGQRIRVEGPQTRFFMEIRSMQMNRKPIETATPGMVIGLKIPRPARPGDGFYPA